MMSTPNNKNAKKLANAVQHGTITEAKVVMPGDTVIFSAKLRGPVEDNKDIRWIFKGKEIIHDDCKYTIVCDNRCVSLQIKYAMPEDEGDILCLEYDSHENLIKKTTMRLIVSTKGIDMTNIRAATIVSTPSDTTVLNGNAAEFKVTLDGQPPPTVTWFKGKESIKTNDRISVIDEVESSVLRISNTVSDDSGKYVVQVENKYGVNRSVCYLTVKGRPDPPAGPPTISTSKTGSMISWWSPHYDGGCEITGYNIEWKKLLDGEWITCLKGCPGYSCTLPVFPTRDTYLFRVRAINAHGLSDPSPASDPVNASANDPNYQPEKVILENGDSFYAKYEITSQIGQGKFGEVYLVKGVENHGLFAAKVIRVIKAESRRQVQIEVDIMNSLRHPKLAKLFAAYEMARDITLVMEYIQGGELFKRVIADNFELTERECIMFMREICDGVAYIHSQNVVHMDLKPENIMCVSDTTYEIKLIDFGLAHKLNPDGKPICVIAGTPEFVAPEIVNYEPICTGSDMWSLGVIAYLLLSGMSPFADDIDAITFANITKGEYSFPDEPFSTISDDAKDFISKLLIKRKDNRMSAVQCLHHKWLSQHDRTMSVTKLKTDRLKSFVYRRKWARTRNAIVALSRMSLASKKSAVITASAYSPNNSIAANANVKGHSRSPQSLRRMECLAESEEESSSSRSRQSLRPMKRLEESGDVSSRILQSLRPMKRLEESDDESSSYHNSDRLKPRHQNPFNADSDKRRSRNNEDVAFSDANENTTVVTTVARSFSSNDDRNEEDEAEEGYKPKEDRDREKPKELRAHRELKREIGLKKNVAGDVGNDTDTPVVAKRGSMKLDLSGSSPRKLYTRYKGPPFCLPTIPATPLDARSDSGDNGCSTFATDIKITETGKDSTADNGGAADAIIESAWVNGKNKSSSTVDDEEGVGHETNERTSMTDNYQVLPSSPPRLLSPKFAKSKEKKTEKIKEHLGVNHSIDANKSNFKKVLAFWQHN